MSNYFCLYCPNYRDRADAVEFLKAHAPRLGVIYKLFPDLSTIPQLFKEHNFGVEGPGFFAICFFNGDRAAVDPRKFCLADKVIWSEFYSQDENCARYFGYVARRVLSISSKRRRMDDSSHYGSFDLATSVKFTLLGRLVDLKIDLDEMERQYERDVRRWQAANSSAIKQARGDKERMDGQIRKLAASFAVPRYEAFKKNNPSFNPKGGRNVYAEMFQQEYDRIRNEYPYKIPMDNCERVLAGRPERTPDHLDLIAQVKHLEEQVSHY